MLFTFSTNLEADADTAWRIVKKTSTFQYVARGLLGLACSAEMPEEWQEGCEIQGRLVLLHFLPAWRHQLRVVSVDGSRREIQSTEHGGPMRIWNHTLTVEPNSPSSCRYTDRIEVGAGYLTQIMWPFVQAFFRYRQVRLRRLVRQGAAGGRKS
jgi:hypothetical protein